MATVDVYRLLLRPLHETGIDYMITGDDIDLAALDRLVAERELTELWELARAT